METKDKILDYVKKKASVTGRELSELLGISRQAVNKHLRELILKGLVLKRGTTKDAIYSVAVPGARSAIDRSFRKKYLLKDLEEDRIFEETATVLNLKELLNGSAFEIANYAFTEILNNAIDHSKSEECAVEIDSDQYTYRYKIRDYGIGLFYSIFDKFKLQDENTAIGELLKGKTTTMRERHTGEGIFFTSKAADRLSLRSHKINLVMDNLKNDVFVEEKRFIEGTEVRFSVNRRSKRNLSKIFDGFAPEEFDYRFERTRVLVKLFKEDYISRSEAKRMLSGLDRFKEIILDFDGVKSIGQGFADQVFRIFRKTNPDITVRTENVPPILRQMIDHVVDNNI
jgi:DNA-binding MarR family transcriptional regulator